MAYTPQELLELQRDLYTNFQTVIDGDHRYIHDGKKFSVPIEKDMAQNEKYFISFKTPNGSSGVLVHWRPATISSINNAIIVRVYEDLESTSGSSVTPICMNRHTDIASLCTVKKGVTATADADKIIALLSIGSGGGPQSRSGASGNGSSEEIVLKPDTEYIIQIDEPNVGATKIIIELRWYEEN